MMQDANAAAKGGVWASFCVYPYPPNRPPDGPQSGPPSGTAAQITTTQLSQNSAKRRVLEAAAGDTQDRPKAILMTPARLLSHSPTMRIHGGPREPRQYPRDP